MSRDTKTAGITLRILCVMLLVFLGLSHQPFASAASAQDMASYVLPDGSVASLCIPDDDGKQGKHASHGCEACRIGSSAALTAPLRVAEKIVPVIAVVSFATTPERFHRLIFPPSAPPRGPPSIPVSFVTA